MMKSVFMIIAGLLLLSCGSADEIPLTDAEMVLISQAAGMLARNAAYPPDSEGWSPVPDEMMLSELETMAENHVELWPVFFRAAADTAAKLEQLEIQSVLEEQQADFI